MQSTILQALHYLYDRAEVCAAILVLCVLPLGFFAAYRFFRSNPQLFVSKD